MHKLLQPGGWPRPSGYANGIAAQGTMVFTAGVIGWNAEEEFEHTDFAGQFDQALANIVAILAEADASPEHIVRMTCFVKDRDAYIAARSAIGDAWKRHLGRVYPCMAVIVVSGFVEQAAQLEIETTAVIPAEEASKGQVR